ncbi:YqzL family protein [Salipaludibacillus agaradhaerens]|uniref:YqzL family protein n=1 Tax=Salipaludibacillus agaradhaerens TaxID=76935 RepID=A0A9Q4B2F3_SALAG|nr:YqzL family protein [Salipaludibacillus agaradhaerens]UJW57461.1 YqzL family protein [Bacillus sp. A116_S68]MCR6096777.1 YqzL family protein [Salipaludibacillus agaradhaerens]MCR6106320.1 YqzL family protein [Salipaludibacillus agaradhaerens]MCR6113664.1 YqzL family protein [Salipaludibacillus agaradhaerens]MCR6118353.1 YqzL family protein [Salipaludibacillus agaradhaerens]
MRQLSWHVFSMTGDVESYLLFKEIDRDQQDTIMYEQDDGNSDEETIP